MRRFSGIGLAWITATIVAVTIAAAAVGSVRSEVTDTPIAFGVSASPATTLVAQALAVVPKADVTDTTIVATTSTLEEIPEIVVAAPNIAESTEFVVVVDQHTKALHQVKSLPQGNGSPTPSPASTLPQPTNPPPVTTTPDKPPPKATTTTSTSTTTTTVAPPTTTTTTTVPPDPPDEAYTRVIATDGGSISVRVQGDTVYFKRGFARHGWRLDLANTGPQKVEARFQRNDDGSVKIWVTATAVNGELIVAINESP